MQLLLLSGPYHAVVHDDGLVDALGEDHGPAAAAVGLGHAGDLQHQTTGFQMRNSGGVASFWERRSVMFRRSVAHLSSREKRPTRILALQTLIQFMGGKNRWPGATDDAGRSSRREDKHLLGDHGNVLGLPALGLGEGAGLVLVSEHEVGVGDGLHEAGLEGRDLHQEGGGQVLEGGGAEGGEERGSIRPQSE